MMTRTLPQIFLRRFSCPSTKLTMNCPMTMTSSSFVFPGVKILMDWKNRLPHRNGARFRAPSP